MAKEYVTQGNIKLKLGNHRKLTITPLNQYSVIHDRKTYTLFVDVIKPVNCKLFVDVIKPVNCKLFEDNKEFDFDHLLVEYLFQAASAQTKLQISIDDSDKVVGIQVPA